MTEAIVKKLALQLLSEECYDNYFLDFDFLDGKFLFVYQFFVDKLLPNQNYNNKNIPAKCK